MSFSRFFLVLTAVISVAGAGYAANPAPGPVEAQAAPLLPQQFGGWQRQGSAQISADAVVGDPANADVLKEYGFTDFAACTYVRDDGRTLKIRAARFGTPAALSAPTRS